jgi:16S rRNA (cytidine1402-2'-O)-methyltransferase
MLYIVATPIGNLGDITLRALEILKSVDGIICEDTRRTSLLLQHFEIKKPLLVLNDFNEVNQVPVIIENLTIGKNLALVSDAGTPLISDPGYKLVRECLENNLEVDSIPGPVSPVVALTLSGLPPDKFTFYGYPPEKPGKRKDFFGKIKVLNEKFPMTNIIFVSPHKLVGTLHEMEDTYGDIEVVLAHELTKIHQSAEKKKVSQWLELLKKPKGEYILLFRIN